MKRRQFITLIGGAAVGWPLAVRAQQPKVPTVGVLVVGSPGSEQFWRLFREGMRDLGYVEGHNIRFEFRSDEGQASRLPELAAELVRLRVDIIVTWFTPAARAAKQATHEIPVVIALAGNPVETGLVESLARPGENVTGMSSVGAELAGKSVELIRELLPSARRVAALVPPRCCLCGQDLERRQARRSARRATDQIRAGHQSENRQSARPQRAAITA
jgi:ABC-type uncharacterized transport system substrate-binding protein